MIYNDFFSKLFNKEISIYDEYEMCLIHDGVYSPKISDISIPDTLILDKRNVVLTPTINPNYKITVSKAVWENLEGDFQYAILRRKDGTLFACFDLGKKHVNGKFELEFEDYIFSLENEWKE